MANKVIHIIGGGTISHVRCHLALAAPAYGTTARKLAVLCAGHNMDVQLHLTKMAGGVLETNGDIASLVDTIVATPASKLVFFSAALVDFVGVVNDVKSGKHAERLRSRQQLGKLGLGDAIELSPQPKILGRVRKERKDIFLVGFKTTSGKTPDEQYVAALDLLKESSANLVLANDVVTRMNMVVCPEESRYHVTTNRDAALVGLVKMALSRCHLTFTRSTVVDGERIQWQSGLVYPALRTVVDYCIAKNAYKPFRGVTTGHFACKLDDNTFLTSIRKTNFNDLPINGLVRVKTDGPDSVVSYGAKPSVGGQSQRIVFYDHPEYDCIVHFHCPLKPGSHINAMPQWAYECGSHECGKNTSVGLQKFGNLSAVMLEEHGPNIVFHHSINPQEVIDFIEANFDLSAKTGGYVDLGPILKNQITKL